MRILIVEDEEALVNGLKFNFEQEGYDVLTAGDGRTALEYFDRQETPIDLVVLDLMLPGLSGYEICQAIREFDQHLPIIVLSARTLSEDKARAFDCGTDQYMTKPFALPELLSRIRNLLDRRVASRPRGTAAVDARDTIVEYLFDDDRVRVDFQKYEVTVGIETHDLTTMEMQLLRYFVENEGIVLSRANILEEVWDQSPDVTTRSIDNFVMRLRRLIETDPAQPRHILSVRGTGYRFVAEPAEQSGKRKAESGSP